MECNTLSSTNSQQTTLVCTKSIFVSYWMANLRFLCYIINVLIVAWNRGMGIIVHSRTSAFEQKSNFEVSRDVSLTNWWDQSLFYGMVAYWSPIMFLCEDSESQDTNIIHASYSLRLDHFLLRSSTWKLLFNTCLRLKNNPHINVLEFHGSK